jgi:hypothetical protein
MGPMPISVNTDNPSVLMRYFLNLAEVPGV